MKRPLSDDPKAVYGRGYAAGVRKLADMRASWRKAFDKLRERTERAEQKAGMGQCQRCVFWRRERNCLWGYCDMARASETPAWPMPWAHLDTATPPFQRPAYTLTTFETFGCVLFEERTGAAGLTVIEVKP